MNRRAATALGLGALLVLFVLAVDLIAPPPEPGAPDAIEPETVTPVAGTSTCAVGDGTEGTGLAVTAARPGEVGEGPSEVEIVTFGAGDDDRTEVPPVFPGVHARATVETGEDHATGVAWRRGAVSVQREWRLAGTEDLPAGTVAGPCPSTLSDRWVIPGMITVGGSEARLRMANPFGTDATVAVGFVTPEGPEQPLALQNLSVPSRGTLEIDVNEVLPERDDLSAVVRVLSGRAVVEGYQLTRAAIGDIDGATLLAASTEPAETWTVPWVSDTDTDDSWLWVVNLGDRPAPVELTLHTADGGIPPEGLSEVTVAPGQLRRIDLRGTLPEGVTAAGVTARSDGAPIHVSSAVRRRGAAAASSGFVVQLAVPQADASWVVSGGAVVDGRRERLNVVNPGSEPADFSIALFNGSTVTRPAQLTDLTIGPGEHRHLVLEDELAGADSWSAFLTTTTGEVVVGRLAVGGYERGLHLVAAPGAPGTSWGTPSVALPSRAVPGMVQRLGTSLGVQRDGLLPDDPEPPGLPRAPDAEEPEEPGELEPGDGAPDTPDDDGPGEGDGGEVGTDEPEG